MSSDASTATAAASTGGKSAAAVAAKPPALSSARRSAILLLALDDDSAATVLRHLSAREVQEVTQEMAHMDNVSHEDIGKVLNDFQDEVDQYAALNLNSADRIRTVLEKAVGAERAASLLSDILDSGGTNTGIDSLNLMEPATVSELIREEHPQIIATILVHLQRRQAAEVLETFNEELRNDVVLRIATFSGVQPAALQELTEVLSAMLEGQNLRRSKMSGVHTAAEILNLMHSTQEEAAIATVRKHNAELAQSIIDEMLLFENLLDMDDLSIQRLLKDIDTNSLKFALKGASEGLREKFLKNMSTRAAQILRDDMEASGPIRISQVEREQKAVLQVVRNLVTAGEIVMNGSEDGYV